MDNAMKVLKWLESLHETLPGTNTVTQNKHPLAQEAARFIRAALEAKDEPLAWLPERLDRGQAQPICELFGCKDGRCDCFGDCEGNPEAQKVWAEMRQLLIGRSAQPEKGRVMAEPVGDLAATTLDEVEAWSLAPQEPTADETERLGFRNMSECDVDGGVELWWKNGELIRVTVVARDAFNRSKIVSMRIPDAARTSTAEVEARALEDAANIFQMCHQPKVASELREMAKRRRSECHE